MRLLLLNREEQEDDLLSMIHSLHLSRQVILTGHLSREEMAACYAPELLLCVLCPNRGAAPFRCGGSRRLRHAPAHPCWKRHRYGGRE